MNASDKSAPLGWRKGGKVDTTSATGNMVHAVRTTRERLPFEIDNNRLTLLLMMNNLFVWAATEIRFEENY